MLKLIFFLHNAKWVKCFVMFLVRLVLTSCGLTKKQFSANQFDFGNINLMDSVTQLTK